MVDIRQEKTFPDWEIELDDNGEMRNQPPVDVKQDFADRLNQAMAEAGVGPSIQRKATAMGVSKGFMYSMMNGIKLPSRERSIKFAAMLGVRESWLMEGSGPMRQELTPLVITHWSQEDQAAILSMYASIEQKYQN